MHLEKHLPWKLFRYLPRLESNETPSGAQPLQLPGGDPTLTFLAIGGACDPAMDGAEPEEKVPY
jgi:hypothetical protein